MPRSHFPSSNRMGGTKGWEGMEGEAQGSISPFRDGLSIFNPVHRPPYDLWPLFSFLSFRVRLAKVDFNPALKHANTEICLPWCIGSGPSESFNDKITLQSRDEVIA